MNIMEYRKASGVNGQELVVDKDVAHGQAAIQDEWRTIAAQERAASQRLQDGSGLIEKPSNHFEVGINERIEHEKTFFGSVGKAAEHLDHLSYEADDLADEIITNAQRGRRGKVA